jgi:hypothetical protein
MARPHILLVVGDEGMRRALAKVLAGVLTLQVATAPDLFAAQERLAGNCEPLLFLWEATTASLEGLRWAKREFPKVPLIGLRGWQAYEADKARQPDPCDELLDLFGDLPDYVSAIRRWLPRQSPEPIPDRPGAGAVVAAQGPGKRPRHGGGRLGLASAPEGD